MIKRNAAKSNSRKSRAPALARPRPEASSDFDWPVANEAEEYLRREVDSFLQVNDCARELSLRMSEETGTDFFEWIDHLILGPEAEPELRAIGFELDAQECGPSREPVFEHPQATLPRVVLSGGGTAVALRPESVADFMGRQHVSGEPEGEPLSRLRRIVVAEADGTRLEAVERRAYRGFTLSSLTRDELRALVEVEDLWRRRRREFADAGEGVAHAHQLLDRVLALVGVDLACHTFFAAERAYWESRNRAARVQKHRQDQLGLGWGNHDHHTFRCSREQFREIIVFLERMGLKKRERFYAGAEAGWGAQVMEQPVAGIVVFADVDLLPEETELDFSKHRLPAAGRLSTVGLWVALHGESLLEAGMHHLEARFDFERLRTQLHACGVATMKPFSDFDFLKQAFTEGERWPVRRERAEKLTAAGLITDAQCAQFIRDGALGSHLENLQRHGGFKGFNQRSVSAVIEATDPRKAHFHPARAEA